MLIAELVMIAHPLMQLARGIRWPSQSGWNESSAA
jgi:hypothetical protein